MIVRRHAGFAARALTGAVLALAAAGAVAAAPGGPRSEAPMMLQPGDSVLVVDADTALRFRVEGGQIVSGDHRAWPRVPNDPGATGPVATCYDDPAVRVGICEAGSVGAAAMIYVVATKHELEAIQLIGRSSRLPTISFSVVPGVSRMTSPHRAGEIHLATGPDGAVAVSGAGGTVDSATGCWRDSGLDLTVCDDASPGAPAIRVTASHEHLRTLYILSDPGAPLAFGG